MTNSHLSMHFLLICSRKHTRGRWDISLRSFPVCALSPHTQLFQQFTTNVAHYPYPKPKVIPYGLKIFPSPCIPARRNQRFLPNFCSPVVCTAQEEHRQYKLSAFLLAQCSFMINRNVPLPSSYTLYWSR